MDVVRHLPPVTKALAISVFGLSLLVTLEAISAMRVVFLPSEVFKPLPEIWRPFTSFLLTRGLGIVFTPYTICRFAAPMEKELARFSSANFVVYLLFVGSVIITLDSFFFGGIVFTNSLILAICWTYAQNHRGSNVHFYFFDIPVILLPWAMLFLTLIQDGPNATFREAMAIPAAHLYEFLSYYWPSYGGGRNFLKAPQILVNYFGAPSRVRTFGAGGSGSVGRNAGSVPGTEFANAAFTSGNSWGQRGSGRRLG